MEKFLVGGAVRDEVMGRDSKDWDFSIIAPSFDAMREGLEVEGFKIFVETPEFYTLRARGPKSFTFGRHRFGGQTFDFVWARKDGEYSDGRRPDSVEPGSLMDDLARRDFKMNAIAKDSESNYIDPFGGRNDIANRIISCVGDPYERLVEEDSLRALRAIRFSVTLGFSLDKELFEVLASTDLKRELDNVSIERVREELYRAFKHDTIETLNVLRDTGLMGFVASRGMWLEPTLKRS